MALGSLLGLLGCDSTEEDCRTLVTKLNGSVDRLRPARVDAGPPEKVTASMRRFGDALSREADTLAALAIRSPELVTQRDAYVDVTRRTSATAIAWADAVDALARARDEADVARTVLEKGLDELEEHCAGSTCHEIVQRMARLTEAPGDLLPKELDALADDLGRVTTELPAIDATLARHREAVRRLAAAIRTMREAKEETEQHRKALDHAATRESQLVDRINGICHR